MKATNTIDNLKGIDRDITIKMWGTSSLWSNLPTTNVPINMLSISPEVPSSVFDTQKQENE